MFWRNMSKELQQFIDSDESLLPAHDIKPYIVNFWNQVKGGQDVVSRMLKDIKIDFRSLSPRCFLLIRQILTQLLNAHLALRLLTFVSHKNLNNFTNYKRLKESLNKLGTFNDFLWSFGKHWEPKLLKLDDKQNGNTFVTNALNSGDLGNVVIPKRNRADFFNGDAGKSIRLDNVGHTLLHNQRPKKECIMCRAKTTVKCTRCEVSLCRFLKKNKKTTCWDRFHNNDILVVIDKKQKYKKNKKTVVEVEPESNDEECSDEETEDEVSVVVAKMQKQNKKNKKSVVEKVLPKTNKNTKKRVVKQKKINDEETSDEDVEEDLYDTSEEDKEPVQKKRKYQLRSTKNKKK
jgi:hypothetical protein